MCRNLNSVTGEARWPPTLPFLLVHILSSISQYLDEKTCFLRFEALLATEIQRSQPYSGKNLQLISYEIWKSGKGWFWFEICLFGFGVPFGFFFFLLLFFQLITFQISAEPRTGLRYQIYISKKSTASWLSKKVHFCLFFHSKSFPYISRFLNNRDNRAWKGFALKCQCRLPPLLFISAFWPEFSDLGLWES